MAEAAGEGPKSCRRDRLLQIEKELQEKWTTDGTFEEDAAANDGRDTFMVTFPYPYMNGRLHLGHAFSLTKSEFAARYQRLNGKQVLFPFSFHCTGMPIAAAAQKLQAEYKLAAEGEDKSAKVEKVEAKTDGAEDLKLGVFKGKKSKAVAKSGGMAQSDILRSMGITDEEIPAFADPHHWLKYFPPFCMSDLQRFGLAADWRRSFITTDVNPFYDQFVRWQFRKLKERGHIKFGKREAVFSRATSQPCADHDRASGEGEGPRKYTLVKLRCQEVPEAWKASLEGKLDKVYLVAATLRPETMYGQTNCFVLPTGTYGVYPMLNGEVFVCSHRGAINLYFQDKGPEELGACEPEAILECKGSDMVGMPLSAPLAKYDTVYVLPMLTISMDKGTGVVTSVPADAPDDYQTLKDFQTDAKMREKHGVKEEWVKGFDVVPVLKIPSSPEFGDACAPYLCETLKVKNHLDAAKLAEAKKESYMKGYHQGIMIAGPHKDLPVMKAQQLVADDMIKDGQATTYWEPEKQVISRSGDECIVAFCDQWYLTYGDEEWTAKVMQHVNENFNMFNESAQNALKHTIDWLGSWACSRTFGLGTRMPWDEHWVIESLSDSTVYMAYYTIAHIVQGGYMFGDQPGPYGIKAEDLTDEVFDYAFCQTDKLPTCAVPKEALEEMRKEFTHWYPMNLRVSGKDLINNHLTMALFNHAAIWPDKPELWPQSYFTNGHVLVDGKKMGKSLGNFLTLHDALGLYGADATRLACADAGDTLEDANYSRDTANQAVLRLTTLEEWATKGLAGVDKMRSGGDRVLMDSIFENEMVRLAASSKDAFDKMTFRNALKSSWFEMENARKEYEVLVDQRMHKDCFLKYLEQIAVVLSPICPHFCDHIWSVMLAKPGLASTHGVWPVGTADAMVARKYAVLQTSLRNFRLELGKVTNVKGKKEPVPAPTHACIYVARQYKPFQAAVLEALRAVELDADNVPVSKEYMRGLQTGVFSTLSKDDAKNSLKFAAFVMANDVKSMGRDALDLSMPFDEITMFTEQESLICKQLKVTLIIKDASEKHEKDLSTKSEEAIPGKASIAFWTE